ncbi:MAG: ADP-ribosylglycohydrolase family protein [Cytophagaceae bacterium]|jgi:ADP-ribosylglycohydrolase|nr:ADP-ribosylglycohydrolase family protein [Cytophagaceae bacterium]
MIGSIAGDIIGAPYEFNNIKTTAFDIYNPKTNFTDDTVMLLANARWLLYSSQAVYKYSVDKLEEFMIEFGEKYREAGYGGMFYRWLFQPHTFTDKDGMRAAKRAPYNSFGNGSAMRVAPVGWAFNTIEETLKVAEISAAITHNHPEGIKGAQATAAAIFMARNGKSKEDMKNFTEHQFGYDLSRTCDEIRPHYKFNETCQHTVPEAIIAFLESSDYENSIRLAVSLGGDSDTLACITGGISEAYYGGVPEPIRLFARSFLTDDLKSVLDNFYSTFTEQKH